MDVLAELLRPHKPISPMIKIVVWEIPCLALDYIWKFCPPIEVLRIQRPSKAPGHGVRSKENQELSIEEDGFNRQGTGVEQPIFANHSTFQVQVHITVNPCLIILYYYLVHNRMF